MLLCSCQKFPKHQNVFSETTSAGNAAVYYFDALEKQMQYVENGALPSKSNFNKEFTASLEDKELQLEILNSLSVEKRDETLLRTSKAYLSLAIACIKDQKIKAFIEMTQQNEPNTAMDSLSYYKPYLQDILTQENEKYKVLDSAISKYKARN